MSIEQGSWKVCKTVLLTGAGFTKEFGGFLADEMWSKIFNQPEVQNSSNLREAMLREDSYNFENVYDEVLKERSSYSEGDKKAFKKAVRNAYELLHKVICDVDPKRRSAAAEACKYFLESFAGRSGEKGFIFTLNQDLFVEKYLSKNFSLPKIPGLDRAFWFSLEDFPSELEEHHHVKLLDDQGVEDARKTFFSKKNEPLAYVKLHGSHGWRKSAMPSDDAMVIGTSKSEIIKDEPLLTWYSELFEQVLNQKDQKLVVIGYGFGDEHINKIIADAIKERGLRLYIVSPKMPRDFKRDLEYRVHVFGKYKQTPYGDQILKGLGGYYPATLMKFYRPGEGLTSEGKDFLRSVGFPFS